MRFFKAALIGMIILAMTGSGNPALASNFTETTEMFRRSPEVQAFFADAYGYAVFPAIGKGGIGLGGAYGKGQVYRQGKVTGTVTMVKVSAGFQFGGQAFSEIIFFQDKRAYEEFTAGAFEFDATASAVAITAGAQAQVGTGGSTAGVTLGPSTAMQRATRYTGGMAVFVKAIGGLMYEAAIGGQKFLYQSN
jgi:lipid-binding SYLF domain-containing protein